LDTVAEGRFLNGRYGKLTSAKSFRWSEKFAAGLPQSSRILKVEQSNSSVLFEDKIYLKLFRKLEEGINPDLEVTRQLSERCNFDHVPTYLGDIQYVARGQEPASLVMMQASVPNLQDGWSHTLAAIGRYYDRIMSESQLPPPPALGLWDEVPEPFLTLIEGAHLENVRLLGERTADLHIALSQDTETPDFAPEPFTLLHQRSIYQSIRGEIKQTMALLNEVKDRLDDRAKPLAEEVLNRSSELSSCHDYLLHEAIQVTKIRIHGDYHLGQLLFTGKDFVILDFEGEPARPIGERRLKKSGLIDVAGMLRSFDYAAHQSLTEGRTVRVVDPEILDAFGDLWSTRAGRVFLDAYLAKAHGAAFVPNDQKDLRLLLRSFLIHKAVYELRYELNNRPKWVSTPLRGLLRIFR
jgi:maltose alpha-D-glucosyltransferase/alpha-amylase